jgi:hypothetical protein
VVAAKEAEEREKARLAAMPKPHEPDPNLLPPSTRAYYFWTGVCGAGVAAVVLVTIFIFVKP